MTEIQLLKIRLFKIEKQLDKNRTSVMLDGWQTQRHAHKSRNWDFLAQEKMKIIQRIEEIEHKEWLMDIDND